MVSGLGMSENVGENDASNNDYLMGFSGLNGHVEKKRRGQKVGENEAIKH